MRYNIIGYLLAEGFRNVLKNKKSTSASLIIMCFTMLIFGVFFMIGENINSIMAQIEGVQGIRVFMYELSEDQMKQVKDYINAIDGVNNITFVSKEEALEEMKSRFKQNDDLLNVYEENNIFPASYVVTLTDLTKSQEVQEKILEIDKNAQSDSDKMIKRITSQDKTVTTLISLANGIRIITGVILLFLIIISTFIISNTIKLTVHARRKEISIMKYVGATNNFIRWPFIIEGVIIGVLSGALSILTIGGIYNFVAQKIATSEVIANMGVSLLSFSEMFGLLCIVYVILGVGIGAIGSIISMRKYLKV